MDNGLRTDDKISYEAPQPGKSCEANYLSVAASNSLSGYYATVKKTATSTHGVECAHAALVANETPHPNAIVCLVAPSAAQLMSELHSAAIVHVVMPANDRENRLRVKAFPIPFNFVEGEVERGEWHGKTVMLFPVTFLDYLRHVIRVGENIPSRIAASNSIYHIMDQVYPLYAMGVLSVESVENFPVEAEGVFLTMVAKFESGFNRNMFFNDDKMVYKTAMGSTFQFHKKSNEVNHGNRYIRKFAEFIWHVVWGTISMPINFVKAIADWREATSRFNRALLDVYYMLSDYYVVFTPANAGRSERPYTQTAQHYMSGAFGFNINDWVTRMYNPKHPIFRRKIEAFVNGTQRATWFHDTGAFTLKLGGNIIYHCKNDELSNFFPHPSSVFVGDDTERLFMNTAFECTTSAQSVAAALTRSKDLSGNSINRVSQALLNSTGKDRKPPTFMNLAGSLLTNMVTLGSFGHSFAEVSEFYKKDPSGTTILLPKMKDQLVTLDRVVHVKDKHNFTTKLNAVATNLQAVRYPHVFPYLTRIGVPVKTAGQMVKDLCHPDWNLVFRCLGFPLVRDRSKRWRRVEALIDSFFSFEHHYNIWDTFTDDMAKKAIEKRMPAFRKVIIHDGKTFQSLHSVAERHKGNCYDAAGVSMSADKALMNLYLSGKVIVYITDDSARICSILERKAVKCDVYYVWRLDAGIKGSVNHVEKVENIYVTCPQMGLNPRNPCRDTVVSGGKLYNTNTVFDCGIMKNYLRMHLLCDQVSSEDKYPHVFLWGAAPGCYIPIIEKQFSAEVYCFDVKGRTVMGGTRLSLLDWFRKLDERYDIEAESVVIILDIYSIDKGCDENIPFGRALASKYPMAKIDIKAPMGYHIVCFEPYKPPYSPPSSNEGILTNVDSYGYKLRDICEMHPLDIPISECTCEYCQIAPMVIRMNVDDSLMEDIKTLEGNNELEEVWYKTVDTGDFVGFASTKFSPGAVHRNLNAGMFMNPCNLQISHVSKCIPAEMPYGRLVYISDAIDQFHSLPEKYQAEFDSIIHADRLPESHVLVHSGESKTYLPDNFDPKGSAFIIMPYNKDELAEFLVDGENLNPSEILEVASNQDDAAPTIHDIKEACEKASDEQQEVIDDFKNVGKIVACVATGDVYGEIHVGDSIIQVNADLRANIKSFHMWYVTLFSEAVKANKNGAFVAGGVRAVDDIKGGDYKILPKMYDEAVNYLASRIQKEGSYREYSKADLDRLRILCGERTWSSSDLIMICGPPNSNKSRLMGLLADLVCAKGKYALTVSTKGNTAESRSMSKGNHAFCTTYNLLTYDPLYYDVVIIDEILKMDFYALMLFLSALRPETLVVLVGDSRFQTDGSHSGMTTAEARVVEMHRVFVKNVAKVRLNYTFTSNTRANSIYGSQIMQPARAYWSVIAETSSHDLAERGNVTAMSMRSKDSNNRSKITQQLGLDSTSTSQGKRTDAAMVFDMTGNEDTSLQLVAFTRAKHLTFIYKDGAASISKASFKKLVTSAPSQGLRPIECYAMVGQRQVKRGGYLAKRKSGQGKGDRVTKLQRKTSRASASSGTGSAGSEMQDALSGSTTSGKRVFHTVIDEGCPLVPHTTLGSVLGGQELRPPLNEHVYVSAAGGTVTQRSSRGGVRKHYTNEMESMGAGGAIIAPQVKSVNLGLKAPFFDATEPRALMYENTILPDGMIKGQQFRIEYEKFANARKGGDMVKKLGLRRLGNVLVNNTFSFPQNNHSPGFVQETMDSRIHDVNPVNSVLDDDDLRYLSSCYRDALRANFGGSTLTKRFDKSLEQINEAIARTGGKMATGIADEVSHWKKESLRNQSNQVFHVFLNQLLPKRFANAFQTYDTLPFKSVPPRSRRGMSIARILQQCLEDDFLLLVPVKDKKKFPCDHVVQVTQRICAVKLTPENRFMASSIEMTEEIAETCMLRQRALEGKIDAYNRAFLCAKKQDKVKTTEDHFKGIADEFCNAIKGGQPVFASSPSLPIWKFYMFTIHRMIFSILNNCMEEHNIFTTARAGATSKGQLRRFAEISQANNASHLLMNDITAQDSNINVLSDCLFDTRAAFFLGSDVMKDLGLRRLWREQEHGKITEMTYGLKDFAISQLFSGKAWTLMRNTGESIDIVLSSMLLGTQGLCLVDAIKNRCITIKSSVSCGHFALIACGDDSLASNRDEFDGDLSSFCRGWRVVKPEKAFEYGEMIHQIIDVKDARVCTNPTRVFAKVVSKTFPNLRGDMLRSEVAKYQTGIAVLVAEMTSELEYMPNMYAKRNPGIPTDIALAHYMYLNSFVEASAAKVASRLVGSYSWNS